MLRVPRNRVLHRPNTVLTPSVLPCAWRVSSWTLTPFLFPFWSRVAAQKRIQLGKPAYFQKDEYNLDWFRTGSFLGSFASVFIPRFKEKFYVPALCLLSCVDLVTVLEWTCKCLRGVLRGSQRYFQFEQVLIKNKADTYTHALKYVHELHTDNKVTLNTGVFLFCFFINDINFSFLTLSLLHDGHLYLERVSIRIMTNSFKKLWKLHSVQDLQICELWSEAQ